MNDNSMLYLVLLGFASGFINMFAGGGRCWWFRF